VNEIVTSSHLFGNIIKNVPVIDRAIFRDKAWMWSLSLDSRDVSFIFQLVICDKNGECKVKIEYYRLQDCCQSLRIELLDSFEPYLPATFLYRLRYLLR
jgi:hypothetical protein